MQKKRVALFRATRFFMCDIIDKDLLVKLHRNNTNNNKQHANNTLRT